MAVLNQIVSFWTIEIVWDQLEGQTRAPRVRLITPNSNFTTRTFRNHIQVLFGLEMTVLKTFWALGSHRAVHKTRSRQARIDYRGSTRPSDHKLQLGYHYQCRSYAWNYGKGDYTQEQKFGIHVTFENSDFHFSAHYPHHWKCVINSVHFRKILSLHRVLPV